MYLVLMLSLPPIFVASVVGLGLSLFQAITQLQEQTLSFAIKLIAVSLTLFATAPWISAELLRFAQEVFDKFYLL
jgi:type III secretion protein S